MFYNNESVRTPWAFRYPPPSLPLYLPLSLSLLSFWNYVLLMFVKVCTRPLRPNRPVLSSEFCDVKRLRVQDSPLNGTSVYRRVNPQHMAGSLLHLGGVRNFAVKCLFQGHNAIMMAGIKPATSRIRVQRLPPQTTAPACNMHMFVRFKSTPVSMTTHQLEIYSSSTLKAEMG